MPEPETRRAWYTAAELAARWNVSVDTVYRVPRDVLPYIEFGAGARAYRRYSPGAVAAYEEKGGRAA